jgi:hypothetical protein
MKQSRSQVCSVVRGDQLLIISGLVRQDLVTMRKSLLCGRGSFLSCHRVFIHQPCPSWIPRWLQGDGRREWLRA